MLSARLAASTSMLFFAVATANAAPPPMQKVETRGFSLKIPKDWTLHKRVEYGADKHRVAWDYQSPKRNYRFRASIARDTGGTIQKVTDEAVVRMARRVDDLEIVQKEFGKQDGRDYSYVIAKTLMIRKKTQQPFLVFQVLIRAPKHKILIGLNVAASGEKLSDFMELAKPILDSLEVNEPKELLKATPKSGTAGKPASALPAKAIPAQKR